MVAQKFQSFGITIRPRDGVCEALLTDIIKWMSKQEYVYGVTEKEGSERHVHIQIWGEPKYTSDVKKQMLRICSRKVKDWDKAQAQHAVMVKVCWTDWYDQYLENNPDKPEEVNTLVENVPDNTLDYYPDEEEDERMKEKNNAVDRTYYELTKALEDYIRDNEVEDVTKVTVARFLHDAQHISKIIKVIREQKVARATVQTLYAHYTKEIDLAWYLPEVETNRKIIAKVAQLQEPASLNLT